MKPKASPRCHEIAETHLGVAGLRWRMCWPCCLERHWAARASVRTAPSRRRSPIPTVMTTCSRPAGRSSKPGRSGPSSTSPRLTRRRLRPLSSQSRSDMLEPEWGLTNAFQVPVVYHMDYVTRVLMRDVGSIRRRSRPRLDGRRAAGRGYRDASSDAVRQLQRPDPAWRRR